MTTADIMTTEAIINLASATLAELGTMPAVRVYASRKGLCGFTYPRYGKSVGFRRKLDGTVVLETCDDHKGDCTPTSQQYPLPVDLAQRAQELLDKL